MVKLEEVEDEHFNTQQTGEDAWISDSDSGKKPSLAPPPTSLTWH